MAKTAILAATILTSVMIIAFTAIAMTLIITRDTDKSGSVLGKVTRSDGSAYPGIHVYACPIPPGLCGYALTGSDGNYSIQVPNGNYRVQFGRTSVGENPDGFFSTSGFTTNVNQAARVIVSGKPVEDISVRLPY